MWKMLGLSQQAGMEGIKGSFMDGYLHYYAAKNAKLIAVNDRVAIANNLLEYTKTYISGPDFKKQYEQAKKNATPFEPAPIPVRSISDIQKEEIAKTEKSIKDTEKTIKDLPDLAKTFQPILDMHKKNLKEYQNPANPLFSLIAQGEKDQQESNAKRYQDDMKQWEINYPGNVNQFISAKLARMLDLTKGIDYSAALVEKNGKKRFVNPAYESKRTEWKQGFRAGKEVTEAARAFAEKWMREI